MKPIEQLIEKLNDELKTEFKERFSELKEMPKKEESRENIFLMGMIVQFFINNKDIIKEEIVTDLMEFDKPLKNLCEVFVDYVFVDNLFLEVFEDCIVYDYENYEDIRNNTYIGDDYDDYDDEDDEFDIDEDFEGFIHDNEDC